jgi:predicted RNA-binding Zn ribbon-like protein
METRIRVEDVDFMGGHPALDFVDTLAGVLGSDPGPEDEYLRSYEDLVVLGLKTETLSEAGARRLRRAAREDPAAAEAAFGDALRTRALLDALFRPVAEGERPPAGALDELSGLVAEAIARARLVDAGGAYTWSWEDTPGLDAPLWPLVYSALELVTDGPLERVTQCGRCRWLFLDTTKKHSKRWCSMEGCGTDAKKERYVARRRERRAKSSGRAG